MTLVLPATIDPSTVPPVVSPQRGKSRGYVARLPPKAKAGAVILGIFALLAIIGPTIAPFNPNTQNPSLNLSMHAPTTTYWLGTTQFGQDVFSQLMNGIRETLELGFIVGAVATMIAVILGVSAAFLAGVWDELLSLFTNVVLVLPGLPLLIILLGYLPQHGQTPTVVVLSLLSWPWGARVIRAQTLALRNRDFIAAARETGEGTVRIIVFDIIPNEISLIASQFVNTVLYAISASVALAFIGVADLSSWSLGTMLYWAESNNALTLGAWWWFVPPGLCVALIGTGLVLLNFGIDEIGNPRLRDTSGVKALGLGTWSASRPTLVAFGQGGRSVRAAPGGAGALVGRGQATARDKENGNGRRGNGTSVPSTGGDVSQ